MYSSSLARNVRVEECLIDKLPGTNHVYFTYSKDMFLSLSIYLLVSSFLLSTC